MSFEWRTIDMYEKTIESLLHCAEMLVDEARKENPSFDSSDRIIAGIARAQSGLEKELECEKYDEELDLRKLSIKKHHLDDDIVLNSADKAYYVRDDDEDDSLTVTTAKNVEIEDSLISNEIYIVVDKYIDCVFDSSYVIIVSSKIKWTKERYDELSKKIERTVCGEEL